MGAQAVGGAPPQALLPRTEGEAASESPGAGQSTNESQMKVSLNNFREGLYEKQNAICWM